MKTLAKCYFGVIEKDLVSKYKLSPRQVSILSCIRAPHAQDFLFTIPIDGLGQRMNHRQFRSILCYRLAVPMFSEGSLCPSCNTHRMDQWGDHAAHCSSEVGVKFRHNLVRDILVDICSMVGIMVRKEAPMGFFSEDGKDLRPANLLLWYLRAAEGGHVHAIYEVEMFYRIIGTQSANQEQIFMEESVKTRLSNTRDKRGSTKSITTLMIGEMGLQRTLEGIVKKTKVTIAPQETLVIAESPTWFRRVEHHQRAIMKLQGSDVKRSKPTLSSFYRRKATPNHEIHEIGDAHPTAASGDVVSKPANGSINETNNVGTSDLYRKPNEGVISSNLLGELDPKSSAMAAGAPDLLFNLRNNFYIGAYQAAINSGDVHNLSEEDSIERDCLIHRSYIAQGSYQLVVNEIDSSAATPLQAVKLLALYLLSPDNKETVLSSIREWLSDAAIGNNPILRLIAGIIFIHEQDYNEALKYTNVGGTMEL
ncbi:coatomer, epsilon subunit, partial [Tanacetum coccineum]